MGALSVLSPPLLVGWAAWVVVGLALAFWARRVRAAAAVLAAAGSRMSGPRHGVSRPKSDVRLPVRPHSAPDAFGDLQAMLDPPPSASRRPGD